MATGAQTGRIGFLGISATSTGTSSEIGEIRDWSIDVTQDQIDASSNDSSGWNEYLAGQRSWQLTGKALYVSAEADQNLLRESLSSAATRYYTLRPSTTLTTKWAGTGRMASYRVGGTYNDVALFDFVVQGTAAVTYSS